MLIRERTEKEKYQKQIDELKIKLKEAKSDDLIEKENEIDKLKEQIRLIKKEMQYDSNSRQYKELLNKYFQRWKNKTFKDNIRKYKTHIDSLNNKGLFLKLWNGISDDAFNFVKGLLKKKDMKDIIIFLFI